MKKLIISILLINLFFACFSQSYFTAGGARFGTDWGISVQQKLFKHVTAEGIFQSSLFREEMLFTGILEHHFPVISKRFNIYTGAGFHQGFITSQDPAYDPPRGLTIIAGAEITLARFVISYDFKPAVNFTGGEYPWYSQTALSLRYVIIKQDAFRKMLKKRKRKHKQKNRIEQRQEFLNRN